MFMQIHSLTSYHAALLNRDDAGLAKRIKFGSAPRIRVSSQCLKRHWTENLRQMNGAVTGFRTRHFFSREVYPRLVQNGMKGEMAQAMVEELMKILISKNENKSSQKEKEKGKKENAEFSPDQFILKQPALFGKPEADYFVGLMEECAGEGGPKEAAKDLADKLKLEKKNYQAILRQAGVGDLYSGLEGALFGRFVTSDILARTDAAVHVAHSFTVHPLDSEVDFFTVVDDLNRDEETGAAHAGDMELAAGLFYGYVAVDIPLLISNFTGCAREDWKKQDSTDAARTLRHLIMSIATVSPGAKLGSTAPYSFADFVMLEAGVGQPRSLSNAFLNPIRQDGDVTQKAMDAVAMQMASLDKMYGNGSSARAAASTKSLEAFGDISSGPMDQVIEKIMGGIFGGEA